MSPLQPQHPTETHSNLDHQILTSWQKNAAPWTKAIREGQIESRLLVTNHAILDAVLSRSPQSVLDLGCGEGWLTLELTRRGIQTVGVDGVPALIEQAKQTGVGDFRVVSYEDIALGKLQLLVDVVVCNFALFGQASVENLLQSLPKLLNPGGSFILQTLHPVIACGNLPYQDGWREGSWAGFDSEFTDPAPWYFRTLESWIALLNNSGFQLVALREPVLPTTQQPASIIFICRVQ